MEKNLIFFVSCKKNSVDINLIILDFYIMIFVFLGNWFFKYVCFENIVIFLIWCNKWYYYIMVVVI